MAVEHALGAGVDFTQLVKSHRADGTVYTDKRTISGTPDPLMASTSATVIHQDVVAGHPPCGEAVALFLPERKASRADRAAIWTLMLSALAVAGAERATGFRPPPCLEFLYRFGGFPPLTRVN